MVSMTESGVDSARAAGWKKRRRKRQGARTSRAPRQRDPMGSPPQRNVTQPILEPKIFGWQRSGRPRNRLGDGMSSHLQLVLIAAVARTGVIRQGGYVSG